MSYDNTNRGAIWKNEEKETDTHPDFKGSLDVNGVAYWVSAWKRKPDANPNAPALSFSIKLKEEKQRGPKSKSMYTDREIEQTDGAVFADDDIPF